MSFHVEYSYSLGSRKHFIRNLINKIMVRAHGVIDRQIDPSWGIHELFFVPASAPQLV